MKKALCFLFVFVVLFAFTVNAKENPTEHYTIQKGDTLWDISGDKLGDQFLWPNLWRVNPHIENPDLIYPGDVIIIPSLEELMRLLGMGEEKEEEKMAVTKPVTGVEVAEKPKKYIVDKFQYFSSGWIATDYPATGEIFAAPSDKNIFGFNDFVYLKSKEKLNIGDKFFSIRDIKPVHHPRTGRYMGQQIRVLGILEVVGMDGRNFDVPKAEITDSFENLQIGDGIIPYEDKELPILPEIPRAPTMEGFIVESYINSRLVSEGDIVYLDRGNEDGLEVGDIFSSLYTTPVERATGTLQIFSIQQKTSVAVVQQSEQEITVGDMWGNR
jgi:hypothetical protein